MSTRGLEDASARIPCAIVLTALGIECSAVLEHLTGTRDESDRWGTVYTCGTFAEGDVRWRVAVAECGPGNSRAQTIANYAIMHFEPDVVLFVGVAGSLKDDVALGDVVVSTKIYNYHSGKAEKDFRPRPAVENSHFGLEQLARAIRRSKKWLARIKITGDKRLRETDPDVHVAPIAAGEQVDADERSHTHQILKRYYGDAVAVEMEGYGTLVAASIPRVPAIVVRSISDNVLDKTECDKKGWQKVVVHFASAFAIELLTHYRPDPAAGPERTGGNEPPAPPATNGRVTDEIGRSLPVGPTTGPTESSVWIGFEGASVPLLGWPTDLGRGEWILRPEYQSLRARVAGAPHSTTLLLGGPGSGKSALLAKLGVELTSLKIAVLGIKADLLPEVVKDPATLAEYLALPADVGSCVRLLATSGKVVVLIDQLDALAGVIDLRTGRLNALLNLVRELDGLPNVHVVCSCREFERRRDARLAVLRADVLELSLPTWEQVDAVLAGRGVATGGWPGGFKELLRPPQHLKVFLRGLDGVTTPRPFDSYQQMLDALWEKHVTNPGGPPGRSDLLTDVAAAMAERESLWVPIALFEGREAIAEGLVAAGLLARSPRGAALGFTHQTLFEHAWARAFAREKCGLAEYVRERQHGLFVRATLWAGLNYLRGADPAGYRREFARLWKDLGLRSHLRHLLVEFLGHVNAPDLHEEGWLAEALANPKLVSRVLASVRGNPDWFAKLAATHLPRLMRDAADVHGGLLSAVVASAWGTARDTCFALVRGEWAINPKWDALTFQTLMSLPTWDAEMVEVLCEVVERTEFNRSQVLHIAERVGDSLPAGGVPVVARALRGEIERLELAATSEVGEDPDPGKSLLVNTTRGRLDDPIRRLLDTNGLHGVEELAEQAPGPFLREMWPLLVRMLDHIASPPSRYMEEFRQEFALGFDFADRQPLSSPHPLAEAFDVAVRTLAARAFPDFLAFLDTESGRDSETVQRLLARGLAAADPAVAANPSLEFLLADARRFRLGAHSDEFHETLSLLLTILPHLGGEDVARLEGAILAWLPRPVEGENEETAKELNRYNRRDRLRLLTAIPRARLTPVTQEFVDREEAEFPDCREAGVHRIQGGLIVSPVSAAQLQESDEEEVVALFGELTDQTGSHHPRDWLKGGSIQASREFRDAAKADPRKAVRILGRFEAGRQERPAGAAVLGLAESDLPDEELFRLVLELDARGFQGQEFRADAAGALAKRLKEKVGLPEPVTGLLERWLTGPWAEPEAGLGREEENQPDTPTSVLWGEGGMLIPQGSVDVLRALTYGYLMRDPPAAGAWLAALEAHVERAGTTTIWRALCRDLKYLHLADHQRAVRFLHRLFERFPDVLASVPGAVLLARVWWFSPDADVWGWLDKLRTSGWPRGRQAYGELVFLRGHLFPADDRARGELDSLLRDGADRLEERVGLALAAAHSWDEPGSRRLATDVLVGLIPGAAGRLARSVLGVFRHADGLAPDEGTHRLLEAVVKEPSSLAWLDEGWLLEHLEGLLPHEAEAVSQVSRELVRLRAAELGSLQSGWAFHAAHLTSIAITLQRLDGPLRESGLELFEALLNLHIPDAEAALLEIDQRLPSPLTGVLPRPHRPRRTRKRPAA